MASKKVFISYSRADQYFVKILTKKLQTKDVEFWYDAKIETGHHWDITIEQKIDVSESVILVLSKTSVKSQNVMDEMSFAISKNKKILPVLIEDCEVPMRVARYQHIDFTKNKKVGFKTLLLSLGVKPSIQNTLKKIVVFLIIIACGLIIGFGLSYLFLKYIPENINSPVL